MHRHTVTPSEVRVGDRLDAGGKSRVAVIHKGMARVTTRGARSATVESLRSIATRGVYRDEAPETFFCPDCLTPLEDEQATCGECVPWESTIEPYDVRGDR